MSKQKFNLGQWRRDTSLTLRDEVEIVLERIEAAGLDLTTTYAEWLELGFALAQGLGEEGRSLYHRLSRFYSGYNSVETDKQYDSCLRGRGHGITINTFFYHARQAGIDIDTRPLPNCQIAKLPKPKSVATTSGTEAPDGEEPEEPDLPLPEPLPAFPPQVYASMPRLLADVCSYGISAEDTDMLLLGSLTVLSSCLTQVYGIYGQRQVHPNLFLFVCAQASAGKGRLTLCRHLVDVVHADLRRRNLREWEEYRAEKANYDQRKRKESCEEPRQPPVRMLFIPANSTATALFQTLNDNEGQALMFETEGDTLTTTFRSEHGNYSDGLRKAFHHETIAYNRRKDREYVEISMPRLSVMLSGTPRQISSLIPDAENGLFSRFLFYNLPLRPVWNDVFACNGDDTLDNCFLRMGGRFFQFYTRLRQSVPLRFVLTVEQQAEFNRFFSDLQLEGLECFGTDMLASVRRLGLTAFRICMVFSALRLMEYEGDAPLPDTLGCRDDDFRAALLMVPVLLRHTGRAYESLTTVLPNASRPRTAEGGSSHDRRLKQFWDALPLCFNRTAYQDAARGVCISARTADRYIVELCRQERLRKVDNELYEKRP